MAGILERNALIFVLLTYSADKFGMNPWPSVDGWIMFGLALGVSYKFCRAALSRAEQEGGR